MSTIIEGLMEAIDKQKNRHQVKRIPVVIFNTDEGLKSVYDRFMVAKDKAMLAAKAIEDEAQAAHDTYWKETHDRLIELGLATEEERADDYQRNDGVLYKLVEITK